MVSITFILTHVELYLENVGWIKLIVDMTCWECGYGWGKGQQSQGQGVPQALMSRSSFVIG